MKQSTKKYLFITIIVVILILSIIFILPVSLPIVFALITTFFLAPAVTLIMDKTKMNRGFTVFLVFTLFLIFLLLITYILLTKAISQLNNFITILPYTINELTFAWNSFLNYLETSFGEYSPDLVVELDKAVINMLFNLRESISNLDIFSYATSIVMKIPSYIVSLLFYFIALYLFLLDLPKMKQKLFQYFTEQTAEKVQIFSSKMYNTIFGFFKAQFFVGTIVFVVTLIGLIFIAPDLAIIMSIIIWIIDFIPIIGSMIILIPWGVYHIIAGNVPVAIQLFVLAAVILTIRRMIEPKIMGEHIGISPLATLISLYLGFKFFGIIGFLLGPIIVILFTSAKEAGIIQFHLKYK